MSITKYPKIGQFKDVIYEVNRRAQFDGLDENGEPKVDRAKPKPMLSFEGTVKLHGTNSGLVFNYVEEGLLDVSFQSRNRALTRDSDNAGFVAAMEEYSDVVMELDLYITDMLSVIKFDLADFKEVIVYGEWAGGSIQSGVGINQLPKTFFMFGVRVNGEMLSIYNNILKGWDQTGIIQSIYNSQTMGACSVHMDFNDPVDLAKHKDFFVATTEKVEAACPVAKFHGFEGVGEGVVWKCITPGWDDLKFKVKGEKHSKSKVKTLSPVDIAKLEGLQQIAAEIMTDYRLLQGIEYMNEMQLDLHQKNTGAYLKHVVTDCIAEEKLAIEAAGFETKDVGKELNRLAKNYWFAKVNAI